MSNYLFDAIQKTANPEAVFIQSGSDEIWTYQDMLHQSSRLAGALTVLGVRPGDRVAAQLEKSPAAIILYLACLRAGAIYLPLNTAYTMVEMDYFISDAEPALVVCAPENEVGILVIAQKFSAKVATLNAFGLGTLSDKAQEQSLVFNNVPRSADDLAAILYTSGTTGRPKGAMLTHGNLLSNATTLRDYWHFSSADKLIHALPIFHTHGLFVATNIILLAGASMFLLPKFDADRVLSLMPLATVMMGVPTFYVRLTSHPGLTREQTSNMRLFISGSAPLLTDTHNKFAQMTGHTILERYGMTETNMNTSNPYNGERLAGSVGLALPQISVRITDPQTGKELNSGQTGSIEVKGPNVFKGYWRMPEKTREEFRSDGFFITGDLGSKDTKGYISIVGRSKDLVISGGYNIYPKEIEAEIDECPGVLESTVIGVPHPDLGEGVTALVVREVGSAIDERNILEFLNSRLARYKQPKRIVFVAELPRNTMGKIQKNVLRDSYWGIYQGGV